MKEPLPLQPPEPKLQRNPQRKRGSSPERWRMPAAGVRHLTIKVLISVNAKAYFRMRPFLITIATAMLMTTATTNGNIHISARGSSTFMP